MLLGEHLGRRIYLAFVIDLIKPGPCKSSGSNERSENFTRILYSRVESILDDWIREKDTRKGNGREDDE
jgi:hypothetical protein